MPDIQELSDIIQAMYVAATGDASWQTVATLVAQAFDTHSAALFIQDSSVGQVEMLSMTNNFAPEFNAEYAADYYRYDEFTKRATKPEFFEKIVSSEDILSDQEMLRSEHYRLWGQRYNQFYFLGSGFALGAGNSFGAIGLHASYQRGQFDEAQRKKLKLLQPHLRQAYKCHLKFNTLNIKMTAGFDALAALSVGVIVTDAQARILFANQPAEGALQADVGLISRNGRLTLTQTDQDHELKRLIANAASSSLRPAVLPGGSLVVQCTDKRPLVLTIHPMHAGAPTAEIANFHALIFVTDPNKNVSISTNLLRQIYGLTPAETRLARAVTHGVTLQDYALSTGISLHTVKDQLKKIFAKSGHGRQSDFVRDVLSNPILRLEPP